MVKLSKKDDYIYFLKTGNYLIPFRGTFKNKKKLTNKLHEILDDSLSSLIKEWEKRNHKLWKKNKQDIISNNDMYQSVHIMRLQDGREKFYSTFFNEY